MRFILMLVVHVLVQEGFCSECFITETTLPLNAMMSVSGSVLDIISA